ncbi:hypothetical protein E2562_010137 [Oryza meyeriana var. granulata]|uniref:Uncharacterized protein n=1 Tax=Oryza meyeriana var. granulata TaxID=110450 RepID=A0A6G1EI35_9ORYZ|nr:hypothetical protein E2562_010137 [Oryza meyeriana var. granulata]
MAVFLFAGADRHLKPPEQWEDDAPQMASPGPPFAAVMGFCSNGGSGHTVFRRATSMTRGQPATAMVSPAAAAAEHVERIRRERYYICQPHIFSNGYQMKFNEEPSEDCDIGYIVPKWVDEKPSIDDIQELSVREVNDDPKASKLSQISISSEVDYRTQKDINAESYTLHLAMQENKRGDKEECTYYMWKQKFAVNQSAEIRKEWR